MSMQSVKQTLVLVAVGLIGVCLDGVASPARASVVLQYHHVSDTTPAATSVTPDRFREHMDYLAEHDFEVVSLEALVEARRDGKSLPDRTIAITFDDAYSSVYTEAFPLLKKRDWPFTVFVNTVPLDQNKSGFASWAQLKEMANNGAIIANHTTHHNHLQRRRDGEGEKAWRQRIEREVVEAEARIEEETGQSHKIVAYPYGEYNNEVKTLLKSLGFVAFGQQSGPVGEHSDLQALPRFPFGGAYGDLEDFATKVNTRPMPIDSVSLYADMGRQSPLKEVVVPAGQRPVLAITLSEKALAERINCFASGQGAIETRVEGETLITRANDALRPGRVRYNCTASSGERGRFYWFSQQWLVTDQEGRWVHEQ